MAAQVNGDTHPSSATLSHIVGYPLVSDAISTIKGNPYGQKSIELGDSAYNKLAKPIFPYFTKPYEYVSPYVKKADELGEQTLTKIDERVPLLKKPTGELYTDGKNIIFFPYRKSLETKDHVISTYNAEYKKVGGEGVVTYGKAAISTGLVVTVETLNWIRDILNSAKTTVKENVQESSQ